jgi:enamine deaminase RidA (YjgF/YER057c/UK114 family)
MIKNLTTMQIQHINPEGLIKNPAFTNVITVSGNARTIYIGEQNSNNAAGEIVAKGDFKAQTVQVLNNIRTALQAAGADTDDIIKLTMYMVHGQSLQEGFEAFKETWGMLKNPPVITGLFVSALANPDYLIGIEAIAVVGG